MVNGAGLQLGNVHARLPTEPVQTGVFQFHLQFPAAIGIDILVSDRADIE